MSLLGVRPWCRRAAVMVMLLLAACSTRRTINAYPGPERPAVELATLTVARPKFLADEKVTLYIIAIDGVRVAKKSIFRELIATALVAPGHHSVTFGFYDANSNSVTPATLSFDAVAGATYELHAGDAPASFGQRVVQVVTTRGRWQGWMTERSTGRVVAGSDPRSPDKPQ